MEKKVLEDAIRMVRQSKISYNKNPDEWKQTNRMVCMSGLLKEVYRYHKKHDTFQECILNDDKQCLICTQIPRWVNVNG